MKWNNASLSWRPGTRTTSFVTVDESTSGHEGLVLVPMTRGLLLDVVCWAMIVLGVGWYGETPCAKDERSSVHVVVLG